MSKRVSGICQYRYNSTQVDGSDTVAVSLKIKRQRRSGTIGVMSGSTALAS